MPNRVVRDGILTSFQVNALSPGAELFYRRLMSVVDDFGRMEDHPEIILAKCFPLKLSTVNISHINEWMAECTSCQSNDGGLRSSDGEPLPLVSQYTVRGKKYLQINNFGQRARTEKYPGPEQMTVTCQSNDGGLRSSAGLARASTSHTTTTTTTTAHATNGHGFSIEIACRELESVYPAKGRTGLIDAQRWYAEKLQVAPDPHEYHQRVMDRMRKFWIPSKKWQDGYVKNFDDFVRNERWRESPEPAVKSTPSPYETPEQMREREAASEATDEAARAARLAAKRSARKETQA